MESVEDRFNPKRDSPPLITPSIVRRLANQWMQDEYGHVSMANNMDKAEEVISR